MNRPLPTLLAVLAATAATAADLAGHRLLVTSVRTGDTEVFIADPVTGDLFNVTRSPRSEDRYPCWSPDGKRIAFTSERDGATNLYVIDAEGTNLRRLVTSPAVCYMPSWQVTPDGERIVFGMNSARSEMASIKPDGSDLRVLGEGFDPTLSPDGRRVTYTGRAPEGGVSVFVMNHDGTEPRRVVATASKVGATFPNWSPDSQQIVYSFPAGDALELFIVNADGTGERQLTKFGGTSVCTPSAWSPDGHWISFRKTDERYWSNPERMKFVYATKPADKRPVWVIRSDGTDAALIEPLRFQMAIDGSRASWKPMPGAAIRSPYERAAANTGLSPYGGPPTQFVLLDTLIRFVPAAHPEAKFPEADAPQVIEWKKKYPDGEINFPDDGFRVVFSHPQHAFHNPSRHYRSPEIPDNWLAPVNFHDGTIHYRVEVFEKPNTSTVTSLLCRVTTGDFEGTHNVWFGHGVVAFREPGVHRFTQPVIARRPFIADTKFDFRQPLFAMQLAVTDLRGMIVHRRIEQGERTKFEGSPDLSLHLPLKVRYTAIVVAQGAELRKPAWW
jgi:TolB protein